MYFDDEVESGSSLDALSDISVDAPTPAPAEESSAASFNEVAESPAPEASSDPLDDAGWSLDKLNEPTPVDASLSKIVETDTPNNAAASDPAQVLQQYGGLEGAVETLNVVNGLVEATPEGVTGFLQTLYDLAQPAYTQLVDQVIQYNPEYAIAQLQAAGALPQEIGATSTAVMGRSLEPDVLEAIPEELRATALGLPDEVQEELNLMSDAMRNQMLSEKKDLADLRSMQEQQIAQAQQARYQEAVQTGYQQREALIGQMEQAHLKVLNKWQPFGPDATEQNNFLYESLMEGTMRNVLQDPKFATMYADFNNLMTQAPVKALEGNKLAADRMMQQARGLAAQFNTQYGRVLQQRVAALDPVFRGYRGSLSSSPALPERKEIRGSVISDGNKVNARGPDGRATDDFLRSLAASITTTQ